MRSRGRPLTNVCYKAHDLQIVKRQTHSQTVIRNKSMIFKRAVLPIMFFAAGRGVYSYGESSSTGSHGDSQMGDGTEGLRRRLRWRQTKVGRRERRWGQGGGEKMGMGHHGGGMGMGHGDGGGMGHQHGMGMGEHMEAIHNLMWNSDRIERVVNETSDGVITITTSDDPVVAEWIVLHVQEMKGRLESGRPVRQWDPLFEAIFDNHDQIILDYEKLWKNNGDCNGVMVEEHSVDSRFGAALIQAHAATVTSFLDPVNGHTNMHKPHPVPNVTDEAQAKEELELREPADSEETDAEESND